MTTCEAASGSTYCGACSIRRIQSHPTKCPFTKYHGANIPTHVQRQKTACRALARFVRQPNYIYLLHSFRQWTGMLACRRGLGCRDEGSTRKGKRRTWYLGAEWRLLVMAFGLQIKGKMVSALDVSVFDSSISYTFDLFRMVTLYSCSMRHRSRYSGSARLDGNGL